MILDKKMPDTLRDAACQTALSRAPRPLFPPPAENAPLLIQTARFGTLEADPDLIITFPDGLIGFETCQRFLVVRHAENSAFRWLQSLEEPAVAFPVIEPNEFRADYAPTISDSDARSLALTTDTPTLIFAVVTVPPHDPRAMTANLLGPLVINGLTRQGRQVIIQDEGYTTRHSVVEEMARTPFAPARNANKAQDAARVADRKSSPRASQAA